MALIDKLTNIADAIRGKTGKTEEMTLDQMPGEIEGIQTGIEPSGSINISTNGVYDVTEYAEAVVNVASSGGASAIYSGSFTPAENVLNLEIDVGGEFTHFVLYTDGTVTGHSVKGTYMLLIDEETPVVYGAATNNAGTSNSAILRSLDMHTDNQNYNLFALNNTGIRVYPDSVHIATSAASGSCLGYFISGVTYKWFAW